MSSNWVYFSVLRSEIVCCSPRWQDCILGKTGDRHILLHGESLLLIIFGNWYATSSSALSTLMMWSYWQMSIYSWWVFFVCSDRSSIHYDALLITRQRSREFTNFYSAQQHRVTTTQAILRNHYDKGNLLRENFKYYFTDFVRKGGGSPPNP